MTCVQSSCKYEFCWECSGPFHTVVSCARPRILADSGSVLAFEDLDKKCASHYLARQVKIFAIFFLKFKSITHTLHILCL